MVTGYLSFGFEASLLFTREQELDRPGVFPDFPVAEPPGAHLPVHEGFHLVLAVGVEKAAGDAAGQNGQDLVGIPQVHDHAQGRG